MSGPKQPPQPLRRQGLQPRLWPWPPWSALALIPVILGLLLVLITWIRCSFGWPQAGSDNLLLTGAFILSLLPLVLVVVEHVGGSLELGFLTVEFEKATDSPARALDLLPGINDEPAMTDTGFMRIKQVLLSAMNKEVAKANFSQGQGWWETRLLLFCAGAARLGGPQALVFVDAPAGGKERFLGWAPPRAILAVLLAANPEYRDRYHKAQAAASWWAAIEPPQVGVDVGALAAADAPQLARQKAHLAFANPPQDPAGQLYQVPNPLAPEEFLAEALKPLETGPDQLGLLPAGTVPERMSAQSLTELPFSKTLEINGVPEPLPPLHRQTIDLKWSVEKQLEGVLESDTPFVAVTEGGEYRGLLSQLNATRALMRALLFASP